MAFLSRVPYGVLEDQSHTEIDDVFGEIWAHTPMVTRPNYPPCPDPAAPAYLLTAKFSWEPKQVMLGLEDKGVSSRNPHMEVHSCQLLHAVRRGDVFTRCATGDKFEVLNSNPDSYSGVVIDLVQLGRPT